MQKLLDGIPASIRQGLFAVIPLVIVFILFISVGKFGIGKISDLRNEITEGNNTVATLTQKLNILQSISATVAQGSAQASVALPDTNPSLVVISQLKSLAVSNGLAVSGVKSATGPINPSGLGEASITFTVDGPRDAVFAMLAATANMAPIMVLDKVKISESAGALRADAVVKSFWAPLPRSIPAVTQPIKDLSQAERQILTDIQSLTQPAFTETVTTEVSGVNTAPFGE